MCEFISVLSIRLPVFFSSLWKYKYRDVFIFIALQFILKSHSMVLLALFCLGLLWLYLYCERCNRNFNRDCLKSFFDSKCIQTMCFQTRNMEHTLTHCLYFTINLSSKFHFFIIKIFILLVKYFHMLLYENSCKCDCFLEFYSESSL